MAGKFTEDIEDKQLVLKILDGESNAFETIVRKYQKLLYFAIRKIVASHAETDDVLQETLIKAYHKLHTYNAEYPFYPWLHRIAINTAINHYRRDCTRKESSLEDLAADGKPFPSDHLNPQNDLEKNEFDARLKLALDHLPAEQRTVFLLRTSEGLSYEEISAQLEISMGTVMSRLSRARDKLKTMLRGYF